MSTRLMIARLASSLPTLCLLAAVAAASWTAYWVFKFASCALQASSRSA